MIKILACLFFLLSTSFLCATHGLHPPAYSVKSGGMGGVAAAYPQDTIISAVNPAGMYWVPDQFDANLTLFMPFRKYSYSGTPVVPPDNVRSGRDYFFIPDLGFSKKFCGAVAGVSIYALGGTNTSYPRNNPAFGQRKLGIDLLILKIAPTLAIPLFPSYLKCHSIGIAPLIGIQTLKLAGLDNFEAFSSNPPHVTNNGYDWACGIGVRVGWMGKLVPCFFRTGAIWGGASYASPVLMSRFNKYAGLLAGHGRLNTPANYAVGLRWEISSRMNLCFDHQGILYSGTPALHNTIDPLFEGISLGDKNGAGFGWRDVFLYKIGLDYVLSPCLKIRGGGSFGNRVFDAANMDANIIAPVVTKSHLTVGATWKCSCCELDFAYIYTLRNSQEGDSRFGLGQIQEAMYQHSVGIGYHTNF